MLSAANGSEQHVKSGDRFFLKCPRLFLLCLFALSDEQQSLRRLRPSPFAQGRLQLPPSRLRRATSLKEGGCNSHHRFAVPLPQRGRLQLPPPLRGPPPSWREAATPTTASRSPSLMEGGKTGEWLRPFAPSSFCLFDNFNPFFAVAVPPRKTLCKRGCPTVS